MGVLRASFLDASAAEVRQAVETAVKAFEAWAPSWREVGVAITWGASPRGTMATCVEALAYHAEWVRTRPGDYQPDVLERLRAGAFVSGVHYVRGQQARALVRAEVNQTLAKRDVLLSPATPIVATRIGEMDAVVGDGRVDVRSSLLRFTRPFNFSGHPAGARRAASPQRLGR